jgi:uncharacterized protein (DUF433 family)
MHYEFDGITIDPEICGGKPTITGHRITVQTILEFLSAGNTPEMILDYYSTLTLEDISACLRYAARTVGGAHRFANITV